MFMLFSCNTHVCHYIYITDMAESIVYDGIAFGFTSTYANTNVPFTATGYVIEFTSCRWQYVLYTTVNSARYNCYTSSSEKGVKIR